MRREVRFVAIALLVIVIGSIFVLTRQDKKSSTEPPKDTTPALNKKQFSISDPNSVWVVVNKKRPLQPRDYVPQDLTTPNVPLRLDGANEEMKVRKITAINLQNMVFAAKQENINLMVASAYRSYNLQTTVYGNYVSTQGRDEADAQSARPGFSEHQTGLAVDLEPTSRKCEVEECFADTPEGRWLAANAYNFGFIMRYPKNQKSIVGYKYEPWHFRYVGRELARELHEKNNPPLETFFDLPAAPDYN